MGARWIQKESSTEKMRTRIQQAGTAEFRQFHTTLNFSTPATHCNPRVRRHANPASPGYSRFLFTAEEEIEVQMPAQARSCVRDAKKMFQR
jgi:hypothetical protein